MNVAPIPNLRRSLFILIATATAAFAIGFLSPGPARASQAGKEMNEADAELNKAYQALLGSIKAPEQRAALVSAQKSWIKFRDDDVAFFGERFQESKGGLFYNIDITKQRAAALRGVLKTGDN